MKSSEWPRFRYRAEVLRVIDGDTVEADVDLGLHVHVTLHLRLAGYNAPEMHGPNRQAAADAKAMLTGLVRLGTIYIATLKDGQTLGRYLAEAFVEREADGELVAIAEEMRSCGYDVRQGD